MAAHLPSAAPNLDAIASALSLLEIEKQPYDCDRLVQEVRHYMANSVENVLKVGALLCVLKAREPHGKFMKIIAEEIGMNYSTAQRLMKAALTCVGGERRRLAQLGQSKLFELITLDVDDLDVLSVGKEIAGFDLEKLHGMTVKEVRKAVKVIKSETRLPLNNKLNDLLPLMVGDVVESRHAKRRGRAVKIYPDGSACVCWDDGEPQPEGMGHERMPRELLVRVGSVASTASEKSEMDEPFSSLVNVELPTSAVENTSRDDHGRPADAHGFASEARDLRTLIDDRLYDLMQGIRQTRTMLKMLHHYFDAPRSSKFPSVDDWSDVMDMVEVALKTLPHHYDDFYDPLEEKVSRLSKLVQDKDDGTGLDQVKRAVAETRPGV